MDEKKKTKIQSLKISDSDRDISKGSRADTHWRQSFIEPYYKKLRPGIDLPELVKRDDKLDYIVRKYQIKAIGFGNWVTIEDRHNYVNSLVIALYDMNKVFQFPANNLGMDNTLAVTFGARGMGGALAHFEPNTNIINITRYDRGPEDKIIRFLGTGGIHSFAHEYGHFLDYFAGSYLDKDAVQYALTGGRSIATRRLDVKGPLRKTVEDILQGLIWKDYLKTYTPFYKRLSDFVDKMDGYGDYFIRRNEMFARAFEVFISYELGEKGITNYFLAKSKYTAFVYPKVSELKPLIPLFRQFIAGIREKIK